MSTNHPDTGIVELILDMDSIEVLPAPVSRHLARGDFGIPVILHGLQHPEHNPYLVIRQTAALPQSLAVTTRDTCLCQLSVPGHAPPSPHVTPHTRDRAKLSQAETQIISPEIMPSPLSLGFTFIHGSTIISCISVTDHFHLLSNIFYILFLLTELPPPKCRPAKVHAGT